MDSEFIKNDFAHFEKRTTVANNNESYTGIYVYGENTYFEFFDESGSKNFVPRGLTSGMTFGVEKKDEFKVIQQRFKEYKNGIYALRSRELNGVQIPWFFITAVFYGKTAPDIMTWVMEYHEDFLKKWHPDLVPSSSGITRKDILMRYKARITKPDLPEDRIIKDIIEVKLRLNPNDIEVLKDELAIFNYTFFQKGNKEICIGPDIRIIIDPINKGVGKVTGIKMSTHSNRKAGTSFSFGEKSRLIFHPNNTATWTF
jgi:hypothetical protein